MGCCGLGSLSTCSMNRSQDSLSRLRKGYAGSPPYSCSPVSEARFATGYSKHHSIWKAVNILRARERSQGTITCVVDFHQASSKSSHDSTAIKGTNKVNNEAVHYDRPMVGNAICVTLPYNLNPVSPIRHAMKRGNYG